MPRRDVTIYMDPFQRPACSRDYRYRDASFGVSRNDQLSPAHEFISRASFVSNRNSQAFVGERLKRSVTLRSERKREGSPSSEGDMRMKVERARERRRKERERKVESDPIFANTQISKGTRLCDVAAGMSDGALRRRMQIQIEHDKLLLSSHPVFRTSL